MLIAQTGGVRNARAPSNALERRHRAHCFLLVNDGVGRMAGACSRAGVPRGRLRLAREQCDWEKTGMDGRAFHLPSPWRYVKSASAATTRLPTA